MIYDINKAIEEYKEYRKQRQKEFDAILKRGDKQALEELIKEYNRLDQIAHKKDNHKMV